MKRIIAAILVFVLVFSFALSLAGCTATTEDMALTMGQWVTLVSEAFGMQNFLSDTPYFKNVDQNNPFFAPFQMVAEWDILAPSEDIKDTTAVRYKDVLTTLVNAGGFLSDNATEEEKIDYAIKTFDSSIRTYWMNRYIRLDKAVELLDKAQKYWAEKPIENPIHEAKLSENVKNYLEDELEYTVEDGVIKISADKIGELSSGDVFALPCSGENAAMIKKVTNVTYDGGYAYIQHEEVPDEEMAEYAENITVRDSTDVDFSNIVGIYDEAGNPIVFEESDPYSNSLSSESTGYYVSNLVNCGEAPKVVPLGNMQNSDAKVVNTGIFDKASGKYTFTIKGNKITLTLDGKKFGIKWSKDSEKKNNQYRDTKTTKYVSVSCDHIKLEKDIDISWGKIKSALLKIDYKTKIEGGVEITTNNKVGQQDADGSEVTSSISSIIGGYKEALSNITKGVNESKYTNDSVYICRIKVVPAGFAAVDFIVKGVVTVTGQMKIEIEIAGCQGVEYKNGKVRYINSKGVDTDFVAEGRLEATISPGFAITILEKWVIGEILLDVGAGVSAKYTAHLFDSEMHRIHTESGVTLSAEDISDMEAVKWYTSAEEMAALAESQGGNYIATSEGSSIEVLKGNCLELQLYPIIRLSLGDGLLPNLLKSTKLSLSYEFLGKDDIILTFHFDFGPGKSAIYLQGAFGESSFNVGTSDKCSFDFKPWDSYEEELPIGTEDPTIDHSDILTTETITLSAIRITLKTGETGTISITGLPKGYSIEDIVAESGDKKIATIDTAHGTVTAHDKTGTTLITVKTGDGKYKVAFAVTVVGENEIEFEGINGAGGGGGGGGGGII